MHPQSSLTVSQRTEAVELFEHGIGGRAAAHSLGVSYHAVRKLYQRWRIHGRDALVSRRTKQQHSFETKLEVVQRFLSGNGTVIELATEYDLSSTTLVRKWVNSYRQEGEEGLRPRKRGRPPQNPPRQLTELEALQQENARLLAEVAYLKKVRALRAQGHR